MLFKKKCPNCGARNSKERTACIECGAPFASRQVEGQVAQVTTEGETQKREGLYKTIEQPTAHKKSAWFWVGVTLLSISALWWLLLILAIVAEPEDVEDTIIGSVIFTVIPIGIGVYCLRRGRKPRGVEAQGGPEPVAQPVREAQQSITEIVIKTFWWFRVIAWGELLFGLTFFIGFGSASLADPNSETLIPAGFGLFFILLGIWMVGMTTKVTFDKPPGYMTVTRGHIPLFLWFLRTKRISRDEARSVFIGSAEVEVLVTYDVIVKMNSGKEVKLYKAGFRKKKAEYLVKRIRDFAPMAELEFSPDAKFSMRVDAAIQGIDRDFNFNGSYDPIELGEVSLARARELMRRLPDEEGVGPVSKDNKDLCPPNLILSFTRMVKKGLLRKKMVGQSIVLNLAGGMERGTVVVFDDSRNIFDVQMSFSEADEIISHFFRKAYEELAA